MNVLNHNNQLDTSQTMMPDQPHVQTNSGSSRFPWMKVPMVAKITGVLSLLVIGAGLLTVNQLNKSSQDLQSQAATGSVKLEFEQPTGTITVGQEKTFNIVASTTPTDLKVSAAVIRLRTENQDMIDVTNITPVSIPNGFPVILKPFNVEVANNQSVKQWMVTLGAAPNQPFSGKNNLVAVTIKAKNKVGKAIVDIEQNSEVAAFNNSGNVYDKALDRLLTLQVVGQVENTGICTSKTAALVTGSSRTNLAANTKVAPGGTVEYTVNLALKADTNKITIRDAFPTAFVDYVPNSVKINGKAPAANTFSEKFGLINLTYAPTAAEKGKPLAITYQVKVKSDIRDGEFENKAFVTFNDLTAATETCGINLAIGNPASQPPTLTVGYRLQGVNKLGITLPTEVTLVYKKKSNGEVVKKVYNSDFTSKAVSSLGSDNGVFYLTNGVPITLTDVDLSDIVKLSTSGTFGTGIELYVKTPTALRKKLGEVTYQNNQPPAKLQLIATGNNQKLTVGDFDRSKDQENFFRLTDVTKMLNQYKNVSNKITDTNREYDVNFDGFFDNLDVSLIIDNYRQIVLQGDNP